VKVCLNVDCDQTTTVTITVIPVNDPPTADPFDKVYEEDTGVHPINVLNLSNAADVEGDNLSVTIVALVSGDSDGIDTSDPKNWLVDTNFYQLAPGETKTIVYTVTIVDGNGENVGVVGTITIIGCSELPLFETVFEDTGVVTLDIPDPVTSINIISGNATGVALVNDDVIINCNMYELPKDDTIEIVLQICYDVSCDETTTCTITVIGVNDPPTADPFEKEYFELMSLTFRMLMILMETK
jgi:hypothetical protein